jgi:hypothetical protein
MRNEKVFGYLSHFSVLFVIFHFAFLINRVNLLTFQLADFSID